jgi:hypothetical protein
MQLGEHIDDMNLVKVLLGTTGITEPQGKDSDKIGKPQLQYTPLETDDKGYHQKIRPVVEVLRCTQPLHIIHHCQIEVQVQNGQQPGEQVTPSQVELIGHYKNISSAKINQCTDIQPIYKVRNNTYEVGSQYEQDELVEPDGLFPLGMGRLSTQAGIDDVLIEGFTGQK